MERHRMQLSDRACRFVLVYESGYHEFRAAEAEC